ncbi:uncharacterized protein DUF58 [Haloactinospora alba]|uniref:Uncharacterized protein DUF58 n=1 Tax=Haloactinospora alba TaxID=405555 RepID=A0A543NIP5_9ACTN|nr:DUF58 domain-containing protein [Haloactinospora alba]TQN31721.1 uncharacterized protein DUF58 [Haloactinospora alba]
MPPTTRAAIPIDRELTAALRHLDLRVVRRLEGLLHGEHPGLRVGPGSEPAEARVYHPGEDDIRLMDWAVTARTTTPHVRDPVADHELESWTLLDLSASMDFGTAHQEKREVAMGALAALTMLTQRVGDRFGVHFLHNGRIRRWPARSGKAALITLLATIKAAPRDARPTADTPNTTSLPEALHDMARSHPRRGLRIIISDFLDTPPEANRDSPASWERPLRHISARHQTLAVTVSDPRETDLPAMGLVPMTDPETGKVREVHLTPALRDTFHRAATAQRQAIHDGLRRCGVEHIALRTDRDWVADIARFVTQQRRSVHNTPPIPR